MIAADHHGPELAPTVVFSPGTMLDRTLWRGQLALQDAYRLVRFDPRGLGATPAAEAPFDPRDDLHEVMCDAGVQCACFVAQSGGAIPLFDWMVEGTEAVSAAVAFAPGVSGYLPPPEEIERFAKLASILESRGHEAGVDFLMDDRYFRVVNRDPTLRRSVREVYLRNPGMWASGLLASQAEEPALPRLEAVRIPVLVVVGTEDAPHMQELSAQIASRIPLARLEVVEGAGHLLPLEDPRRANGLLRAFLREH